MSKRRRRGAQRRIQAPQIPMMLKVDIILAPIEQAISQIYETGFVDTADGEPVMVHHGQRKLFGFVPALQSVARLHEGISHEPARALQRLAKKLQVSMPVAEADLTGARVELTNIRRWLTAMPAAQAQAAAIAALESKDDEKE